MQVCHINEVSKLYSQVSVETVRGSEHREAVDDRPAAEVPVQDLDADLPGPRPVRSIPAPHYTRGTRGADQGPLPTA